MEVTYGSIRFDIAAMDGDSVFMGIEIYSKHRAERIEIRDEVKWVEFDCHGILSALNASAPPSSIKLKNLHSVESCSLSYCLPFTEMRERLGYHTEEGWGLKCTCWIDEIWEAFLRRRKCLRCYRPWETRKGRCYCSACYDRTLSEEARRSGIVERLQFDTLSRTEIGQELGYCRIENIYVIEQRKYMDIVLYGKHLETIHWYSESTRISDDRLKTAALWNILQKLGKCLRCGSYHGVKKGRPYCRGCYNQINDRGILTIKKWTDIPEEERIKYYRRFSWLAEVPTADKQSLCFFCERSRADYLDTKYSKYWEPNKVGVKRTTRWLDGKRRRCCTICLEEQDKNRL